MRNDHCHMFNVPLQHKISHVKNYVNLLGVIKGAGKYRHHAAIIV
jgi:hypothetical protein